MERKSLKTLTTLLSKTAGLVFFSFLAISLGVVFGLLFDGWVKDQPGAPVDSRSSLETVELPITSDNNAAPQLEPVKESELNSGAANTQKVANVKFKVRVGPYSNHDQAVNISKKLEQMGYPVFVGNNPPFAVQVGAFSTRTNAEKLRTELGGMGYKSFIEQ
ncbi:MAG TPA: SPOR domain-containing protein [Bacillota bacterium]|nr:SPOR domain-containing protein [Bacillota bacterium]